MCILKQHRNERYVSCDWLKEFTRCFKSMRSSLMMEVTHRLSENTTEEEIGHDEDSDVPLDSRTIGPEPGLIPVSPGLCDWVWWIPALQLKDTRLRRFFLHMDFLLVHVSGGERALVLVFLQLFLQQQQEGILSPNIHVFRTKSGLEFMLLCKTVAHDSD